MRQKIKYLVWSFFLFSFVQSYSPPTEQTLRSSQDTTVFNNIFKGRLV